MNNIISKIRKNAFLLAALSLGGLGTGALTGCGDFLEIEPQNEITLEKYWNEKADVEAILMGCYSMMEEYSIVSRMMVWGEFRSDNVEFTGGQNDDINLQHVLKETITSNNDYTYWGAFYTVINRCNTILKYAPNVAAVDPSYTKSQLNADLAEATAIRSLCYFYLIRTFRDVPYSEEAFIDDGQQLATEAVPFDTVLDKLINSLEAVKDNALSAYPVSSWTYSTYFNTARMSKWAIYAMLTEMYLWKGDYQNSIRYADLIIQHKKEAAEKDMDLTQDDLTDFNGYPLIGTRYSTANTYGRAFNKIFVEGNSFEGIFELTYIKGTDDTQLCNGPFSNYYGGQGRIPWVKYSQFVSDKKTMEDQNNKRDARYYENMKFDKDGNPDYVNKTTCQSATRIKSSGDDFIKESSWGMQYPTYGSGHDSRSKANVIIYRLTDIMLLEAEAYSQLISTDDISTDQDKAYLEKAFELVDAVNKRSLMEKPLKNVLDINKYSTKLMLTNLIYEERQRELMFEGKRYFDLVRRARRENSTEYLRTCCMRKNSNLESVISNMFKDKMNAIYWPYNLYEMEVNPYLKQNPAFGSGENSGISNSAK